MNKAIFLDRDGTLIEDNGYICHLSQTTIFPFAFPAIHTMNQLGFLVIIISNQSSIARGICTIEQIEKIHSDLSLAFLKHNAHIHHFYYCPYHPNATINTFQLNHPWRKPQPGMILQAAKDFNIDLNTSYMIGDSHIDIEAGTHAGCHTILVLTGKGQHSRLILQEKNIHPTFISENILTAINQIRGKDQEPF